MGTLNSLYIRVPDESVAAAVRAAYPSAYTEPATTFYAVRQPDQLFRCPESELQSLSARLDTDVIWLSFQSAVDAFQYHHWVGGNHLRSLVYGCFDREREWERADGQSEEWERIVLFDADELARLLKYCDSDEQRQNLARVYREQKVTPGSSEPSLEARETARGVAKFYRFPGWGLADGSGG